MREDEEMKEKKIAVIFPGIGYLFDRPLLHFAEEQAVWYGYEIQRVPYGGFPPKIRGDREKMRESAKIAIRESEKLLRHVNWQEYSHILFISKSIGTIAAAAYAAKHSLTVDEIFFTPFPETFTENFTENLRDPRTGYFRKDSGRSLAFHGAEDPWMENEAVIAAAEKAGVPMQVYPEGNHSLETGDPEKDIRILADIFHRTKELYSS